MSLNHTVGASVKDDRALKCQQPEASVLLLEQVRQDPSCVIARCSEHWEQYDWPSANPRYRITCEPFDGYIQVDVVAMELTEDGSPVFPFGPGTIDTVDGADRHLKAFIFPDDRVEVNFAPTDHGEMMFGDLGELDLHRELLVHVVERARRILRGHSR